MKRIWNWYGSWNTQFQQKSFLENGIEMLHLAQWAIGKDLEAFKSKMNTSPGRTGYFKIAFNYKFTTASNQELISYLEGRVKLPDRECSFIFMSNECISASLLSYNYFRLS